MPGRPDTHTAGMNPLLYGHDSEQRIVAVHPTEGGAMRCYVRTEGGLATRDEPFYPFFYLHDAAPLENFRRPHWIKRLSGDGYFQWICVFEEWGVLWDGVRAVLDHHNRAAVTKADAWTDVETLHLIADPVTQFLLESGRTLFKGMLFGDLHRLQIDIETLTHPPHRFSNASRPSDRIIVVALSDTSGWHQVLDGKKLAEPRLLHEVVRLIRERDPDVIEGHNILGFDLPYILARCTLNGVPFAVGRDGSVPRLSEGRPAQGEFYGDVTGAEIAGRHVVDTLLLVHGYDAAKRTLESYGLKYAARYFGLSGEDRVVVPGDRITWTWEHEPETLLRYALDDVTDTRALAGHLSGTSFHLTQMLPVSFGHAVRMGSAAKIELLMIREYLREKRALPRPSEGSQTTGGYTDIFLTGVLGPIVHADVESLYPSIMLSRGIAPAKDELGVFPTLLRELTSRRLEAKSAMKKEKEPVERSRLDAVQSSLKILINSFYGYLGYGRGLFNDYTAADMVTGTGQELLRMMIGWIQSEGGKVIEADTDGLYFVPPETAGGEEPEAAYVASLSQRMPEGIVVAHAGRFRRMLSYKKKNYALLSYDERITIRGSALVSRSMEPFGRSFLRTCVDHLLHSNIAGLHNTFVSFRRSIAEHSLQVGDFARVETLRDPPEMYSRQVAAGQRNKSAAYELALSSARPARAGDRIAYYITGNDPNVRVFDNCKAADDWDPNFPDENVSFYLRRLDEFAQKFAEFFHPQDFRAVFSAEELFPFDASGIVPLITPVATEPPDRPDERTGFGIWLDE